MFWINHFCGFGRFEWCDALSALGQKTKWRGHGAKHSTLTAKSEKVGVQNLCISKYLYVGSTTFVVLADFNYLHRRLYFNVWRFDPTRSRSCALPKHGKALEEKFWSCHELSWCKALYAIGQKSKCRAQKVVYIKMPTFWLNHFCGFDRFQMSSREPL